VDFIRKADFIAPATSSAKGGLHPPKADFIHQRRTSSTKGGLHPPKVDFIAPATSPAKRISSFTDTFAVILDKELKAD